MRWISVAYLTKPPKLKHHDLQGFTSSTRLPLDLKNSKYLSSPFMSSHKVYRKSYIVLMCVTQMSDIVKKCYPMTDKNLLIGGILLQGTPVRYMYLLG